MKGPALGVAVTLVLAGCVVNPVTGRREVRVIPESYDLSQGASQYLPAQQAEGGELAFDPALGAYVRGVGERLAAVSDRPKLPYEFVVLDNGVPNAWTLSGGKIAINRGLLFELDDEAELAAVLGHEVVHAAAGHPAQSMQRDLLLQLTLAGVGIGLGDTSYTGVAGAAGAVGAAIVAQHYSRDQELEADRYGMAYMSRAGYDPKAAVRLQETFVRLLQGKDEGWLAGMLSSHPPSEERVEANRRTLVELPPGGKVGRDEYLRATERLRHAKPAYAALDDGRKALASGDARRALKLADDAIAIEDREALFYGLRADAETALRRYDTAVDDYGEAIRRNDRYFQFYLQRGLLHRHAGDDELAQRDLERSVDLLPTPLASYSLGEMALAAGDTSGAADRFRSAAASDDEIGRRAKIALARIELESNPSSYISYDTHRDSAGYIVLEITNSSPVAIRDVEVELSIDDKKDHLRQRDFVTFRRPIAPGSSAEKHTDIGPLPGPSAEKKVEVRIVAAEIAQ